jgi:hypothetical protein
LQELHEKPDDKLDKHEKVLYSELCMTILKLFLLSKDHPIRHFEGDYSLTAIIHILQEFREKPDNRWKADEQVLYSELCKNIFILFLLSKGREFAINHFNNMFMENQQLHHDLLKILKVVSE